MSFCASDWEGHGLSGALPSCCKPLPSSFPIEASSVPDDVFEDLCWEDGRIRLHQNQLGRCACHAPVEAARVDSVDPLDGQANPASIHNKANSIEDDSSPRNRERSSSPDFFDDEMVAWLQYRPDVELHADKPPAVSYLPRLPLEKSHGALYRDHVLMGAKDRKRQYMSSSQGTGLACRHTAASLERLSLSDPNPNFANNTTDPTPGSLSDMQAPAEELVSCHMEVSLPRLDPHAGSSLQSITRQAADASLASLGHVEDKANCIHTQSGGAGMSGDFSLESTVSGIRTQDPSGMAGTDCFKATSAIFHQLHGAVPAPCRPDAVACIGASDFTSNVGVEKLRESHKRSNYGDHAKRKAKKGSRESEIQPEAVLVKKSRTVALRNKSEKMRRDRINEKLKILQKLIPNAAQTDKASLLGQTIEYLKALLAQLMAMSYRTGLTIPPRLIPHSMRHRYVPQLMGAGFGAASTKNKNVKGMEAVAPARSSVHKLRPLMPLPALPPSASWGVGTSYALSTHAIGYIANYFPTAHAGL